MPSGDREVPQTRVLRAGFIPAPVVRAHYNPIVGNLALGLQNDSTGAVDAENNWWGCNAGPDQPGCDRLGGSGVATIDADPWLVLGIAADPTTVEAGEPSQITADLRHNSDGSSVRR